MNQIKILNHGLLTLVQDGGRYGYQQFGVPVSGVMDSFAHRIANILVGNDENEAVLEMTIVGPHIEFENDCVIAITGGDLLPIVNEAPIPMWESIYIKEGDRLSFRYMKSGCRSYIAFSGGIDVEVVMRSKSTYIKGKIGGHEGRPLKIGDVLKIGKPKENLHKLKGRIVPPKYIPKFTNTIDVRIVLGPQNEYFTEKGIKTFLSSPYAVTNECDRMGFRLEGETIEHVSGGDIISDGIALGAIQIPGHGKPIIMMADRQATGGYTKIGNVIRSDLYKIAQAKPGDQIRFSEISVKEAQQILKEVEAKIIAIKQECVAREIVSTKQFHLKINGKSYEVKVEEVK
ncbi:5-oxoprolinase subunit C family protein [Marinisporobacter balticus]|uniref:Biotin-dependent carboxylase-like uncharacterized protein n=1 Tax=Marinisporobacter balticus TaxID=2018667 RepID=A0A4R2KDB7_9FIRM|nr:biotin-dependent carboxyltransferase family protein [Marinisporobacter balticus]TCO71493.1 biotin-dependent carboxylase-like uncharacterized protein [Marinisporobacter balticus]